MIKIGTRKSRLALNQTHQVVSLIKNFYPKMNIEVVPIITSGDIIVDRNLYDIGGKALFLKEIENSLLLGEIDLAVHSFKDVPGLLPESLEIAAVLERANPQDIFISHSCKSINDLPYQAKVGSSSVRRKILINEIRPDVEICVFRGNIDTRLEKLRMGEVDATILSAAGLERLDLLNMHHCYPLDTEKFIPAIGQGVIAVEIKTDHKLAREICSAINHLSTWKLVKAERAFMSYLDANCRTPMGAFSKYLDDDTISVEFMLANFEGTIIHRLSGCGKIDQAAELGVRIAQELESKFSINN